MRAYVSDARPLGPGEVYLPRLARHVLPREAPVQLIRFAARFRSVFDTELGVPKRFDIDGQFGRMADHLHVNVRDAATGTWRFQRFAPAWAERLGEDLTGENVLHPRYAPYNTRLQDKLRQVVEREMPFYAATHVEGPNGAELVHRLLIPMSTTGIIITHCLVFTVV
jgi:hypothetical protein